MFMANPREHICIVNDIFTPAMATALREAVPHEELFFVSDIRTNNAEKGINPDALDILWNLSQQYNWITEMKPTMSMVKFRHPFYADKPEIFHQKAKESPFVDDFARSKELGIDFVEG